jgi:hypothetical protein
VNPGIITTEHTVWCVRARNPTPHEPHILGEVFRYLQSYGITCHSYHQEQGGVRHVVAVARNQGWVKTRELGWVCPNCIKAYRVVKAKK